MNKADIRKIIREELTRVEVIFSVKPIEDGEDKGLAHLVTRLSLPEESDTTTVPTRECDEKGSLKDIDKFFALLKHLLKDKLK